MNIWGMLLIPVSLAVTAMSFDCASHIPDGRLITVPLGSSLTLNCSCTCEGHPVRVTWYFIANISEEVEVCTVNNELPMKNMWCNYILKNVQLKDSGCYYCKVTVDIPSLRHIFCNGTKVVVPDSFGINDVLQSKIFLITSGTTGFILIVIIVVICVVQRRRRRQNVTAMSSNCTLKIHDEPPKRITVPLGSSLTLNCSVICECSTLCLHIRVAWYFTANGSEKAASVFNKSFEEKMWCNYTLTNIQHKDSGRYHCRVRMDVPTLSQTCSNGTEVVVDMRCPIYTNTRPVPLARRKQSGKPGTQVAAGAPPEGGFLWKPPLTAMSSNCTLKIHDEPPKRITVPLGSSLTLNCSVICECSTLCQLKVTWYFTSAGQEKTASVFNKSSEEKMWRSYTLTNIQHKDSGRYHCRVIMDVPTLRQTSSNGREVVVVAEDVFDQSMLFLILSATAVFIVIVLIVLICGLQRKRQRQRGICHSFNLSQIQTWFANLQTFLTVTVSKTTLSQADIQRTQSDEHSSLSPSNSSAPTTTQCVPGL
ncbi:hypothetical protein N1851_002830 [Merluccius polli]|uniref:Ig-like domain-containing protein n=1 Tax=Merluccius polli TaxID=89951 RepID=A0AA47N9E6_MERPO|nr:hypothetical protein N1851_002830 [Merluccius polli]